KIVFFILNLSLISCGGGGGSVPVSSTDNTLPVIVGTNPQSGSNVAKETVITVTFSESISSVQSDNVKIKSIVNFIPDTGFILPENILDIDSADGEKILRIKLANATNPVLSLQDNTIYLVEISGIKDKGKNMMLGTCRWLFATGTVIIDPGLIGSDKCNTPVPNGKPGTTSSNWDELIWDKGNWK
ncbi:MAG: Ig-like domain-containing protein, partial [Gammaproteobacteria bacterium]